MRRGRTVLAVLLLACGLPATAADPIDVQGHRGARALAPENTLAGFRAALAVGVSTLETDLALTADGVLVLSHEPRLNPDLTRGPDGRWITAPGTPIRALTAAELTRFDVGRLDPASRYARQFPEQRAADGERLPRLTDLVALARAARSPGGAPVRLNIETKLTPDGGDVTADVPIFTAAVLEAVAASGMAERVTLQSFDWRPLVLARQRMPALQTACLTIASEGMDTVRPGPDGASPWHAGLRSADHGGSLPRLVQAAGCGTWSPYWRNLTPALVAEAHALGLQVLPWTVNEPADLRRLLDWGVDGIISDRPDRLRAAVEASGRRVR